MRSRGGRSRRGAVRLLATAGSLLLLAGCGGQLPPDTDTPTAEQAIGDGVQIPSTRAGEATEWVLDQLAADEGPDATEATERFDEDFLSQVPAEDVEAVFAELRATGPFVVDDYSGTQDSAQVPLAGPTERFILHIVTAADGRMTGLFFAAAELVPDVANVVDLDHALDGLDAETSLLVAEVEDGACVPVHEREADRSRPVGSIFKLYVLDAVHQAVADGELDWSDTLILTDDLRSLPSGELQEQPAGTEVTVRQAAQGMIAISDNTATDLLIDAVGRDAVMDAVARLGHHAPQLLEPFLTTREMFQLGFTDDDVRAQWLAAGDDGDQQRAVLDGLPGGDIVLDESLATAVVWDEGLDWFATAEDLCRAHVALQDEDGGSGLVREMLAANPGIDVPAGWDYVAFKGGSAPGEMAGSWYLEADSGQRVVVVAQIAATDAESVPDAGWLMSVTRQAVESLSEG